MMNRLVLVALLGIGGYGAYQAFMSGGGKAEWRRVDLVVNGRALSVEMPAAPKTTATEATAEAEDVLFAITVLDDSALASEVATATPAVGQKLAQVFSNAWESGRGVYRRSNVSAGGMSGVEVGLDGNGPRGRGTLFVVSDGRFVVGIGCATTGSVGVGERIKKMGPLCDHFRSSLR